MHNNKDPDTTCSNRRSSWLKAKGSENVMQPVSDGELLVRSKTIPRTRTRKGTRSKERGPRPRPRPGTGTCTGARPGPGTGTRTGTGTGSGIRTQV
jgi:hypothetical protein